MTCEYCQTPCEEGATKCCSCGAPLAADTVAPDFSVCPFCRRKLLALGSPACNYCGKRLPASYTKAREAALNRIAELEAQHTRGEDATPNAEDSDFVRRTLDVFLKADARLRRRD